MVDILELQLLQQQNLGMELLGLIYHQTWQQLEMHFKEQGLDSTSAVCFGGDPQKADTEEFNKSANVITAGAWAAGANYPATIQDAAGCGPVTAAVVCGGYTTVYL